MDVNIPPAYAAAQAKHEAARRAHMAARTPAEERAALAALTVANAELDADPHHQWLQDVRRDEHAAFEKRLSMQPRTVTCLSIANQKGDFDHPLLITQNFPEPLFDSVPDNGNILIVMDARRTSAAQALRLLRAAILSIEENGICVSIAPSPFIPDRLLYVDERPDGSFRCE
jgi:hypothetical protein